MRFHFLENRFDFRRLRASVATDLIRRKPDLDEETVREQLEGNICRCTGYHNIVKSIQQAAGEM